MGDDLGTDTLDPLPDGCRPATSGAATLSLDDASADGLPISLVSRSARTDAAGIVSLAVPDAWASGSRTVRLAAVSSGGTAATTVTVRPGHTVSLTLLIPATTGSDSPVGATGAGWSGAAVASPPSGGRVAGLPAGWVAVWLVLLAALAVVAIGRRRVAGR